MSRSILCEKKFAYDTTPGFCTLRVKAPSRAPKRIRMRVSQIPEMDGYPSRECPRLRFRLVYDKQVHNGGVYECKFDFDRKIAISARKTPSIGDLCTISTSNDYA